MIKRYHYKSLNPEGEIIRGFYYGTHKKEALEHIKNLKLTPIEIRSSYLFPWYHKTKTLIQFCFNLQQLEIAGVPFAESLQHLSSTEIDPIFKNVLESICRDFMVGMKASLAFKKHPLIFDNVFINLIKVGEETGHLGVVLESLISYFKWKENIKKQVLKAIRYPAIIMFILITLLFIFLEHVIPKLIPLLDEKTISHLLYRADQSYFFESYNVIFFCSLSFIILLVYCLSSNIRHSIDNIFFKIPGLGVFFKTLEYTRFFQVIILMIDAEIDLIQAFPIAIESVKKQKIKRTLTHAYKSLCEGNHLSSSLTDISPLTLQIIKTAEKTDHMKHSLHFVKQYYEKNLYAMVEKFTTILEPMLMMCMGLFLMGFVYFILMPIYDGLIFIEG